MKNPTLEQKLRDVAPALNQPALQRYWTALMEASRICQAALERERVVENHTGVGMVRGAPILLRRVHFTDLRIEILI